MLAAADALVLDGHRPTIDRVRMHLGRGSPNTINEHLDRWWRELGARLTALPGQTFPGVPDPVATVLQQLWSVAVTQAQEVLQAALSEREQQLQARAAQLASVESQLEADRRAQQALEETQQAALALARAHLDDAIARARRLEERLMAGDAQLAELRTQLGVLDTQRQQLQEQLQASATAHAQERGRLEQRYDRESARTATEIDRLRDGQKESKRALRDSEAQRNKMEQQLRAAHSSIERLTAELQTAERVRTELMTSSATASSKTAARPRKATHRRAPRLGARKKRLTTSRPR